jgi:hypothetical protein
MMQHFIRAGFGLKLLCDWALFWSHPVADKEKNTFLRLIKECRCRQFAIVMTRLCVFYLGLDIKNVLFLLKDSETAKKSAYEKLMHDIILSEEFGRSDNNRMVLLKGTHFSSYVKEFHHQMRLNNPKYSKFVVLWPFLWLRTLFVFLRNNHTVRKTTLWSILKQTRKRSSLTEELKIFKN